jgi:16S rRNA (cytosine967-C5)-methyltransferase
VTGGDAPGVPARRVALEALARIEDDGAYANLALPAVLRRADLAPEDRSLVTDLVYGTVRRRRSCDHLVDRFLTSDPPPAARRALRLGAYQLAFRDDIPDHAAVSTTVGAAPSRFRGLANAVLRKVATAPVEFPDVATELSYPDWVVERLRADLGTAAADAALAAMDESPTVHVRSDGYVQDLASQWVVEAVGAGPGELVVDLCAAPGGKSTGMAASGATVIALEVRAERARLVASNADRVGVTDLVDVVVGDASTPPLRTGSADRVLLDAPCSGLGVLRRRADARWRVDDAAPERLASLQRALVVAAADLVRPGGVLVYSVCTLTSVESIGVDEHLAAHRPDFEPIAPPGSPWRPWGRGAVLVPTPASVGGPQADGMCMFLYRRRSEAVRSDRASQEVP